MANYRNAQRARAQLERDPERARHAMYAEVLAHQEMYWTLQDLDPHKLVDDLMDEWMAMVGPDGPGRPSQGRGGLRRFVDVKLQALHQKMADEAELG